MMIYWDYYAESSMDVVTGYADFEGYKIYKSNDGGETWGAPNDMIYDTDGISETAGRRGPVGANALRPL